MNDYQTGYVRYGALDEHETFHTELSLAWRQVFRALEDLDVIITDELCNEDYGVA